jgi:molecular chaperone DnaJ
MQENYYDILGLDKNSSFKDIKKKYNELVMKYHPDVNKEADAEEKFSKIQEAYNVLSNENKRKIYDTNLNNPFNSNNNNNFNSNNSNFNFNNNNNYNNDFFEDLFSNFNASKDKSYYYYSSNNNPFNEKFSSSENEGFINNFFERFFQSDHKTDNFNSSSKSNVDNIFDLYGKNSDLGDISFNVLLTFKESCLGNAKKIINYSYYDKNGDKKKRSLKLNLEPGLEHGKIIILKNGGNYSSLNNSYGKLFIQFLIEKDELFSLDKEGNIILNVYINFLKAFFGCNIKIPTLFGFYDLKIPAKIVHNHKIELDGYGIPAYNYSKQINIIKICYNMNLSKNNYDKLYKVYNRINSSEFSNMEKNFFSKMNKKKNK